MDRTPKTQRIYKLTWIKRPHSYSKMTHIVTNPGALTKSIEDWRESAEASARWTGKPVEFEYKYEYADVQWQEYIPPTKEAK